MSYHGNTSNVERLFTFFIAFLMIAIGLGFIVYGGYIGIFTMLIGGIVQIIDAAKMTPTDAHGVAVGIVKVIFCEIPILVGIVVGSLSIKCAFGGK